MMMRFLWYRKIMSEWKKGSRKGMLKDRIEEYQDSIIQHGSYNDRIYLMRLADHPPADFPQQLISLAEAKGYSKIFAKVPGDAATAFLEAGFVLEAKIPGFFSGQTTACFMAYYLKKSRDQEDDVAQLENILRKRICWRPCRLI